MIFSRFLLDSPYPWLFLSALFLGAACSRATSRVRTARDPDQARNRKWVFFVLFLSLALITLMVALFLPGPEEILHRGTFYFYGACTGVFFLGFRFKKSLGIAFFLLLLTTVTVFVLFVQGLNAFTGETEIGRVRVIDMDTPQVMNLEIVAADRPPLITELRGSYFAPVVRVVIFEDFYVFIGAKTWYRFDGITSFSAEREEGKLVFRQQDSDYYFDSPLGITERLWSLYERHERWIPGVRSVQVEMDLKKARPLSTYSIRIQNDGGVQVIDVR